MSSKPLAPNGLPIVGPLTIQGNVARLDPSSVGGPAADLIFELPESALTDPLIVVDDEGGRWNTAEFPIG